MCGVLGWPCLPCPLYCQLAPARLNAAAPRLPNLASHLWPLVLVFLGVVLSLGGGWLAGPTKPPAPLVSLHRPAPPRGCSRS